MRWLSQTPSAKNLIMVLTPDQKISESKPESLSAIKIPMFNEGKNGRGSEDAFFDLVVFLQFINFKLG
jgi:hypothetical protein